MTAVLPHTGTYPSRQSSERVLIHTAQTTISCLLVQLPPRPNAVEGGNVEVARRMWQRERDGNGNMEMRYTPSRYINRNTDWHIWDPTDYVVPAQENNAVFITTNAAITLGQSQGSFSEDCRIPPQLSTTEKFRCDALYFNSTTNSIEQGTCQSNADCINQGDSKRPMRSRNGVLTGSCTPHNITNQPTTFNTCEIRAWGKYSCGVCLCAHVYLCDPLYALYLLFLRFLCIYSLLFIHSDLQR